MDKGKEGPESVMGGNWARERLCQQVECRLWSCGSLPWLLGASWVTSDAAIAHTSNYGSV